MQSGAHAVRAELSATIDGYFATVSAIHRISTGRDDGDALRLVHLRRDLARQLLELGRLLGEAAQRPHFDRRYAPLLAEGLAMFSLERAAVADHQSVWNAPAMQRDRSRYEAETTALFRLHERNHHWRRSVLLPALAR